MTAEGIIELINNSEAGKCGHLRAYDCKRVPKKFHSLFSATWRRYLYLFPLKGNADANTWDVDPERVNVMFSR